MAVRVDLHVHTTHSGTGTVTVDQLAAEITRRDLPYAAITDSGSTQGIVELRNNSSVRVLPGLELSTEEGHFLVFCEDLEFLDSFRGYLRSVSKIPARDDVAVIWAHPWAYTPDGSRRAPALYEPLTRQVVPHVHAVEVFNGNMALQCGGEMLSKTYVKDVIQLARDIGKGMVGGSDAHTRERFFGCWTEIGLGAAASGSPSAGIGQLIRAIREGRTTPGTSLEAFLPHLAATRAQPEYAR